jgi:hypothetical protein
MSTRSGKQYCAIYASPVITPNKKSSPDVCTSDINNDDTFVDICRIPAASTLKTLCEVNSVLTRMASVNYILSAVCKSKDPKRTAGNIQNQKYKEMVVYYSNIDVVRVTTNMTTDKLCSFTKQTQALIDNVLQTNALQIISDLKEPFEKLKRMKSFLEIKLENAKRTA